MIAIFRILFIDRKGETIAQHTKQKTVEHSFLGMVIKVFSGYI